MRLGSPEINALLLALAAAQMALLPLMLLWVWRATRHLLAIDAGSQNRTDEITT